MFDLSLALMTGVDIPMPEFNYIIHQPTIKEISMIGEQNFFIGAQLICLNKTMYLDDPKEQAQVTNFEIFIALVTNKNLNSQKEKVESVLTLLFPKCKIYLTPGSIILNDQDLNIIIDDGNFEKFQSIVKEIFCLKKTDQNTFNPADERAKEIAKKLMRAREKLAKEKQHDDESSFSRYLSCLVVGMNSMSLQDVINLTLYQFYDLIERYTLYINWGIEMQIRMNPFGGGSDTPLEDWMKNIH